MLLPGDERTWNLPCAHSTRQRGCPRLLSAELRRVNRRLRGVKRGFRAAAARRGAAGAMQCYTLYLFDRQVQSLAASPPTQRVCTCMCVRCACIHRGVARHSCCTDTPKPYEL